MSLKMAGGIIAAGKKPKVPAFVEVDAQDEQAKAIQGNLAIADDVAKLNRASTMANDQILQDQIRTLLPGLDRALGTSIEGLQGELRGEIPKDVAESVQRATAERGVFGGFGGSQFGRNLEARDLGLTSLQIRQQALSNVQSFIETARRNLTTQQLDTSGLFLTPGFQVEHAVNERNSKFNRDFTAAQIRAQASPMKQAIGAGLISMSDDIMSLAGTAASFYKGGAGGGG